jgi:hypothetical protein
LREPHSLTTNQARMIIKAKGLRAIDVRHGYEPRLFQHSESFEVRKVDVHFS